MRIFIFVLGVNTFLLYQGKPRFFIRLGSSVNVIKILCRRMRCILGPIRKYRRAIFVFPKMFLFYIVLISMDRH